MVLVDFNHGKYLRNGHAIILGMVTLIYVGKYLGREREPTVGRERKRGVEC